MNEILRKDFFDVSFFQRGEERVAHVIFRRSVSNKELKIFCKELEDFAFKDSCKTILFNFINVSWINLGFIYSLKKISKKKKVLFHRLDEKMRAILIEWFPRKMFKK